MAGYPINLSNGTLITTVNPGTFDTSTFNIALLGRGVANYGEITAENFVHMLEHFAASQPPGTNPNLTGNPTTGQLWYDTVNKVLNVYDTTTTPNWRPIVISSTPGSITVPNGSEPNPGLNFQGDNTTGLYFLAPTTIGVSIGGSNVINITPQGVGFPNGSATAPSIFFKNDPDTGFYRHGANAIAATTDGAARFRIENARIVPLVQSQAITGSATAPSYSFISEPNTGMYRSGTNQLSFSVNDNVRFRLNNTGGIFYGAFTLSSGSTLQATYADLAERYHANEILEPGDLVRLGGECEIEKTKDEFDTQVFGVVSQNPAFCMNCEAGDNNTHPYVALSGRVKTKITGAIKKGQRIVSSHIPGVGMGFPQNCQNAIDWQTVVGRSLEEDSSTHVRLIEIVVGAK